MGQVLNRVVFQPPKAVIMNDVKYNLLRTDRGYDIPYVHIRRSGSIATLLYSHGNSEDIHTVYKWCELLSQELGVDVVVYDYCGYGLHQLTGEAVQPTQANVEADVLDMLDWIKKKFPTKIVVCYGRSLGSAPSIYAAASRPTTVGGLIIESGFTSCVKTLWNGPVLFDLFPNDRVLANCHQLTMVVHGTADHVVPFNHGRTLFDICRKNGTAWSANATDPSGVWIHNAGHNDLDTAFTEELLHNLRHYLNDLIQNTRVAAFSVR